MVAHRPVAIGIAPRSVGCDHAADGATCPTFAVGCEPPTVRCQCRVQLRQGHPGLHGHTVRFDQNDVAEMNAEIDNQPTAQRFAGQPGSRRHAATVESDSPPHSRRVPLSQPHRVAWRHPSASLQTDSHQSHTTTASARQRPIRHDTGHADRRGSDASCSARWTKKVSDNGLSVLADDKRHELAAGFRIGFEQPTHGTGDRQ